MGQPPAVRSQRRRHASWNLRAADSTFYPLALRKDITHECLHTGVSAPRSPRLNCDRHTPQRSTATPSRDSFSFTRPSLSTRRRSISTVPMYGIVAFSEHRASACTVAGVVADAGAEGLAAGPMISDTSRRS